MPPRLSKPPNGYNKLEYHMNMICLLTIIIHILTNNYHKYPYINHILTIYETSYLNPSTASPFSSVDPCPVTHRPSAWSQWTNPSWSGHESDSVDSWWLMTRALCVSYHLHVCVYIYMYIYIYNSIFLQLLFFYLFRYYYCYYNCHYY